jgi:hypothetical protein
VEMTALSVTLELGIDSTALTTGSQMGNHGFQISLDTLLTPEIVPPVLIHS